MEVANMKNHNIQRKINWFPYLLDRIKSQVSQKSNTNYPLIWPINPRIWTQGHPIRVAGKGYTE